MKKHWSRFWGVPALAALSLLPAGWLGFGATERFFLQRAAVQGEATLRLAAAGLRGALLRYEPLPSLIADKTDIKQLLRAEGGSDRVDQTNLELKRIAADVGASDIYVMDPTGVTLAASNFELDTSFVGRSFSYRPYFQDALNGRLGRYFALGTTSLKRGYYFASPVRAGTSIIGVVAVKVGVDDLESAWRWGDNELIVTDDNGVIFMSSRDAWLFRTLAPLDPASLEMIAASKQYPLDSLRPLQVSFEALGAEAKLMTVRASGSSEAFVITDLDMPEAAWTIHLLSPRAVATAQATSAFFAAALAIMVAALTAAYLWQRRVRLNERLQAQREAQTQLERRVRERTADLDAANKRLTSEIRERTDAERRLRKSQSDLVQAGKLAALGQMSAALSHEFNQPLAAMKSYAENANAFLDRQRTGEARENIVRISELVDRIAEISNHLRNFARKPRQRIGSASVATAAKDALQILAGRLRSTACEVHLDLPDEELLVVGGQVRLQQVLVNLIGNALDAVAPDSGPPVVTICCKRQGDRVTITVADNGRGLDEEHLDMIFDPFFTTKGINEGLGLGLSISYNIIKDFGGSLKAANRPGQGAIFTIELNAADRTAEAAE